LSLLNRDIQSVVMILF